MSERVAIIGDINIDVIPHPIDKQTNIKKDGQVFVDDMVQRRGGQGANFAVKLAQLGSNVSFHGKLGDDRNGRFLKQHLQDHGITPRVNMDPNVKTGTTLAVTWKDGERHYISHIENNAALTLDDIDVQDIKNAQHVARRGVWFSESMLDGGNTRLLKKAKEHGAETSIDLHWDPYWNKDTDEADKRRQQFYDSLEYADILMGNTDELTELAKKNKIDKAVSFLQQHGAEIVVVHQGPNGSRIYTDDNVITVPTERIDDPANPTGTGDAYDAGFLNARLQGAGLKEAGEYGTRVAVQHLTDSL